MDSTGAPVTMNQINLDCDAAMLTRISKLIVMIHPASVAKNFTDHRVEFTLATLSKEDLSVAICPDG